MCQAVGLYMLSNSTPYKDSEGGRVIPNPQIRQARKVRRNQLPTVTVWIRRKWDLNPAAQQHAPCDGLCSGTPSAVQVQWDPRFSSLALIMALICQEVEGWWRTSATKFSPDVKPDPWS